MNIEQEIQNILDRNFTRGDNANALKELLVLYNAVEQSEQLKAFLSVIIEEFDSGGVSWETRDSAESLLKSL